VQAKEKNFPFGIFEKKTARQKENKFPHPGCILGTFFSDAKDNTFSCIQGI
jgi:hypothetical protein